MLHVHVYIYNIMNTDHNFFLHACVQSQIQSHDVSRQQLEKKVTNEAKLLEEVNCHGHNH